MNMHTKITASTATLAQIKPGQDYPDGNINARQHYTDAEIDELGASLMPDQDGQIRPFLVATHPKKAGQFFVFGGGRRRLAYERLIEAGKLPKDHPIEIKNHGNIAVKDALSLSLADNAAVPMHPADQAVTFATLAADRAPEEIAKDRGMTVRAVNGLIALGQDLIPEVIGAWRTGKLDRADVHVLVLARPDQQKDALTEVAEDGPGSFSRERFRAAITANKEALMNRLLGFVGVDAAREAGAGVTEDFFGHGGVVRDLAKLEKLANAKMRGLEKAEVAAGWSWADGKITEARSMHHGYGEQKVKADFTPAEKQMLAPIDARLKVLKDEEFPDDDQDKEVAALEQHREDLEIVAQARTYSAKQKAAGGVMIRLRADGSVAYHRGLIRKEEKASGKKANRSNANQNARASEQDPLSWSVRHSLEDWQSGPLGALLAKQPRDAVAALVAGAHHSGQNSVVQTELEADPKARSKDFGALFAKFRKLSDADLVKAIGAMVGGRVSASDYQGKPNAEAIHLIKVVGEKAYQDAMAKAFDLKDYVGGSSKKHMLAITAEAFGAAARKNEEDKTEDLIRKNLIADLGKTGWLPPELRTKAYTGPSAKAPGQPAKPVAATAKKPAKKKAKG